MNNIGVGIGILIFNSNKEILLLLRNSDPKKADSNMRLEGTYTLPSGNINYNESFEDAAIRKTKEESNLDIKKEDLNLVSISDDKNEYAHYVTIGMIANKYSGEVMLKDSEEFVSYDWLDIDNLPSNLCEPSRKIIKNYLNNRIYNKEEI